MVYITKNIYIVIIWYRHQETKMPWTADPLVLNIDTNNVMVNVSCIYSLNKHIQTITLSKTLHQSEHDIIIFTSTNNNNTLSFQQISINSPLWNQDLM